MTIELETRHFPSRADDDGRFCLRVSAPCQSTAPAIMASLPNDLVVKPLRFSNHERIYLIVDQMSGQPLFDPTVYALAQLRPRNLAAATIRNTSYAILALHLSCIAEGIDLKQQIAAGQPLTLPNLQLLRRRLRMSLGHLRRDAERKLLPIASKGQAPPRTDQKKAVREKLWVSQPVFTARMYEVLAYLSWLYEMELGSKDPSSAESERLQIGLRRLARAARLFKAVSSRSTVGKREGLSDKVIAILLAAVKPGSPSNPWRSAFVQNRNWLIILLGLKLGLRIGEILGLDTDDIELRLRKIFIRRRADDPNDPRPEQPNTKTCDRDLSYEEDVAKALENFIIHHRSKIRGARRHGFLIVADKTGAPLSRSAAKKLFQVLRAGVAGLPEDLVAHVLRHCFNDDFSKRVDEKRLPEAEEKKLRNYVNGWSENSESASIYTRRHVRREANKLSLEVQAKTLAATQAD